MKKILIIFLTFIYCFLVLLTDVNATEVNTADTIAILEESAIETNMNDNADTIVQDMNIDQVDIAAPSAILMEASTGQVVYAKNAEQPLKPASITKIMTLLLTFEALAKGQIHLEDQVITSAHAQSMGGSQVFLEEGEIQTVDTLIKCIAVSSGNDAAVAMAEYIAGSEEAFVGLMNEKANELQMKSTHFEDCCGLTDSDTHITSAIDVAIMSRELITKYPDVYNYTKIWMEDIVHHTKRGDSTFTLTSTNKLLRQYPYSTGLKTGSTSSAKYCYSGTASKDGIDLIAVVMAAPDHKVRFSDALKLLQYGFSVSQVYTDDQMDDLPQVEVKGGIEQNANIRYEKQFSYLDVHGNDLSTVQKELRLLDNPTAPIVKDEVAGEMLYFIDGEKIGSVQILFDSDIKEAKFKDYFMEIMRFYF